MTYAWDVATPLLVAAITAVVVYGRRARERERLRDGKLDRIIAVFEGSDRDLITGRAAEPGLAEQLAVIREQLHRNGGTTLRDAVTRIEIAVDDLRAAQITAGRRTVVVETLLRQHMRDGQQLLGVGQRNDDALVAALRAAGIAVPDPEPLPDVTFVLPDDEKHQEGH